MFSLTLLNSSGVMPFLTLTAVFLFIGPVLIIVIATMWSNLKQKISDELSARVTRIVNDLDIKNNTPEIENIFSKLTAEINTKITNELSACLSEVNSTFTTELGRINNEVNAKLERFVNKLNNQLNEEVSAGFGKIDTELNSKLAEIEFFKTRDARYASETQRILSSFEETCLNEFHLNSMPLSKLSEMK